MKPRSENWYSILDAQKNSYCVFGGLYKLVVAYPDRKLPLIRD